ncbi:hypothetical protein [Parasphingorhabdus sp.]|uniref:hypothetical protein n=1 Tax=Parasphingorhabdus sp. TaxID=2709688 RepID=UPI003264EED9
MLNEVDWRNIQALVDMEQSLSSLTFFEDIPDKTNRIERRKFRCFHDSMVISYCRPFTESKGLPKLSLKKLGVKLDDQENVLHKRLFKYRNEVAAHTDRDRMRIAQTSFQVSDNIRIPHIVHDESFEFLDDLRKIEDLVRKILRALSSFVYEQVQDQDDGAINWRDHLRE